MNAGRGCRASYTIYSLPASAQMTWLGSDGSIIREQTIYLPLYASTHHPAPGTTAPNRTCRRGS